MSATRKHTENNKQLALYCAKKMCNIMIIFSVWNWNWCAFDRFEFLFLFILLFFFSLGPHTQIAIRLQWAWSRVQKQTRGGKGRTRKKNELISKCNLTLFQFAVCFCFLPFILFSFFFSVARISRTVFVFKSKHPFCYVRHRVISHIRCHRTF